MTDARAPDLALIDAIADADVGHIVDASDDTSHVDGTSKGFTWSQARTYVRSLTAGFSLLAKQGSGAGVATELALAAQSLIIRAAGDIVALAVGQREVVGRVAGNLGVIAMDAFSLLVPGDASRVRGTNLTNGAETLLVAEGSVRVLPGGTLSGAGTRAKTLGTSGAVAGDIIMLSLLDDTAGETVTVVNGGAGAGTLVTHTAIKAVYEFRFNDAATDWVLSGRVPVV